MALTQVVENGKLVDTSASSSSLSSSKKTGSSSLDKDAFLQLLVAQMKYQDPLEPTSNTEYISQLATFSQLEETQNLNYTNTKAMANDLVGKQVILKVTSSITGETSYVNGQVDYVIHEGNKTYLSVNNKLYSIDDLDTVVDADYSEAVTIARLFSSTISTLPSKSQLTLSDESKITSIRDIYDALTSYQKQFISESDVKTLETLEERMAELKKLAEASKGTDSSTDTTDETDITDETETDTTTDTE